MLAAIGAVVVAVLIVVALPRAPRLKRVPIPRDRRPAPREPRPPSSL
jgi:hypothetical protein